MAKGFYSTYQLPLALEIPGLKLSLTPEGDGYLYRREQGEESVEKLIFPGKGARVELLPVEPVNLPGDLPEQLFISFTKPLVLPPREKARIYLRFPVEVGVFVKRGEERRVIDIFTLARQKLTFVGDFEKGRISKYYESEPHSALPEVNPLMEGLLRVDFQNRSGEWQNLQSIAVPAEDIKLYYSADLVSMVAVAEVLKGGIMKVEVRDSPLRRGMKRSVELYRPGALRHVTRKLLLEVE